MKLFKRKCEKSYSEILDEWLETKSKIKIQFYQKYENIIFRIKEELGTITSHQLQDSQFISFFQVQKNKAVSPSGKKTMFYIINFSLSYAYKNKYCDYIELTDIKLKSLSNEDAICILKKLNRIGQIILD